MNKTDLIKAVAKHSGENEATVRTILNSIVDVIKESLWFGMDIKIKDFISLSLIKREDAWKTHFHNKEKILVPKHYYVKVSLSKLIKDKIKTKIVH